MADNSTKSLGENHNDNMGVDLNTATLEELTSCPMVGEEGAKAIIESRPIHGWDELKEIPGFSEGILD